MTHKTPLLAACLLLAGGCNQFDQKGFFEPETAPRRTATVLDAQRANGAKHDGMLRAIHFTDAKLNGLGREKLDLMAAAVGPDETLKVYLDLPPDAPNTAARRESVVAYLSEIGLPADRYALNDGQNDATAYPAIEGVNRLPKTESSVPTAGPPSAGTGVLFGK